MSFFFLRESLRIQGTLWSICRRLPAGSAESKSACGAADPRRNFLNTDDWKLQRYGPLWAFGRWLPEWGLPFFKFYRNLLQVKNVCFQASHQTSEIFFLVRICDPRYKNAQELCRKSCTWKNLLWILVPVEDGPTRHAAQCWLVWGHPSSAVPRSLRAALALKIRRGSNPGWTRLRRRWGLKPCSFLLGRCLEVDPMRFKHIQTMSGQNTLSVYVFVLPVVYMYISYID